MAEAMAIHITTGVAIEAAKALTMAIIGRAASEITQTRRFKTQLEKLRRKFNYVEAFLEDLGHSNHANRSSLVNTWLDRVKDVAYMADNLMDEFAYEILRRKLELKNRSFNQKLRNVLTISYSDVLFSYRMSEKVREICLLFDEVDKEAKDIGLNQVEISRNAVVGDHDDWNHGGAWNQAREHASHSGGFVGREVDEEILVELLCQQRNEGGGDNMSIVAIVGMGGLGKTTLARRLYDHEKIGAHFANKKHWIYVSENFKITRILNEMVESVTSNKGELSNTDVIIRNLREEINGSKFLLVLDDVWEENEGLWDSFKGSLQRVSAAPGSVILITTRSHEVAKKAGVASLHLLKPLSSEESWALSKQIFISENLSNVSHLEEVGRRIIEKCKGVPLAIKVVGGLLRSKQHLHEWESIESTELWDLPESQHQILPWLMLSFNHLPSPFLKQCFAYCAMITKGFHLYKSELIGLWLSQGYLRNDKRRNLTMEEIGEEYLKILVSNSLLEECVSAQPQVVGYMMHDLVSDLAIYVCGSDLIKEAKDLHETSVCRHLVINDGEHKSTSDFPPEMALTKLRTIRFLGSMSWNLLIHMRYLRTLLLDRTGITEVPLAIELLKHLRFLDLSYNPISTLPDSIGKLYQLQTLILQGCRNMKKLPKVLNKLVSLRHISTTAPMFAWKGLRQLTNLQSLPCLSLDDDGEGWTIDELGDLQELKDEIHILGLEYVIDKEKARKAGLAGKAKVTKLTLSWVEGRKETSRGNFDEDVLEGLEPHPNITSLEVHNFNGENFPTWITRMAVLTEGQRRTQLNNLAEVKLVNCIRCKTLPKLGQLPLLKCLVLSGLDLVEVIGVEFYGGDDLHNPAVVSFPCLRELEISGFYWLTTLMEPPQAAFPRLETLRMRNCSLLKSVPGLGIKSLMSLELKYLYSVETLDIIKYNSGLTSLVMQMLPKIRSLPQELVNCRTLQELHIFYFRDLVSLPSGLESLVTLQSIRVAGCPALSFVPDDLFRALSPLRDFEIVDCSSLRKIPTTLEECTSLETLMIQNCPMIEGSPTNISMLLRLSDLRISCYSLNHLKSLLETAQHLPHLRRLQVDGFRDEDEMRDYFSDITPFLRLPSLTILMLSGRPNIKTLPQQLGLLSRIKVLCIWSFVDLEEIRDWICNLSSLDSLILEYCTNLKCLPSKEDLQRLPGLIYLRILRCPLVAERYAKDGGSEWHNISHIREIMIDGQLIQEPINYYF